MGDIAEAFEEHLRSLSDSDWNTLVQRVRTPAEQPSAEQPNFGQGSAPVQHRQAGDAGKDAAAKRFGTPSPEPRGNDVATGKGSAGRAAAERRFPNQGKGR